MYVGNLSFSVTDADLEDLFAPFGEVRSAQVVVDRQTGRSRGFGFVEMGADSAAQAAIDALHDQEHGGRRLTVNEAKPREDREVAEEEVGPRWLSRRWWWRWGWLVKIDRLKRECPLEQNLSPSAVRFKPRSRVGRSGRASRSA